MKDNNNIIVKYSKASLLIFEIVFGIVSIIMVLVAFKDKKVESILFAFFCVSLCFIIYLIFKSYWVKVQEGFLTYNCLFGRKKRIKLKNIDKAWIEIGVIDFSDLFKPTIRLVIKPKTNTKSKTFYINVKVLEKSNLERLLEILPIANLE
ncbi:MAG TPA: hypothetical protein PLC67_02685 [Spirochaetota bacterium]|nr:hypothetical protein [Spirochaetota bacterium]